MPRDLDPARLLTAYCNGIFPMADNDGEISWYSPDPRAIFPLEKFKVSRSLHATIRRHVFDIFINKNFADVIDACADRTGGTWISPEIRAAYVELHNLGFAHSVEAWRGDELQGGLYGVAIGGAFFGESMFHRATDASKVALFHLVERMKVRGMTLLDTQFLTDHLRQFGAIEVRRSKYERMLRTAIAQPCSFAEKRGDNP